MSTNNRDLTTNNQEESQINLEEQTISFKFPAFEENRQKTIENAKCEKNL